MDDCDLSSMREELYLRMAIDGARSMNTAMESLATCMDCGGPIPEERRKARPGCTRCVYCQECHERMIP